jgi:hypothetical protein
MCNFYSTKYDMGNKKETWDFIRITCELADVRFFLTTNLTAIWPPRLPHLLTVLQFLQSMRG